MGSSVGVTKAHDEAGTLAAIDLALEYDRRVVIEEAIEGRELEISVLGNDQPMASVAGEIVPCNEFYDYNAKYVDDNSELIIPADLSPEQAGGNAGDRNPGVPGARSGGHGAGRFLP